MAPRSSALAVRVPAYAKALAQSLAAASAWALRVIATNSVGGARRSSMKFAGGRAGVQEKSASVPASISRALRNRTASVGGYAWIRTYVAMASSAARLAA